MFSLQYSSAIARLMCSLQYSCAIARLMFSLQYSSAISANKTAVQGGKYSRIIYPFSCTRYQYIVPQVLRTLVYIKN